VLGAAQLKGLIRRARSVRRGLRCFDPNLVFITRPRQIADSNEGSPLFDASKPLRFRVEGGWQAGQLLQVTFLQAPGVFSSELRISTEGGDATAHAARGEWLTVSIERPTVPQPDRPDRIYELSLETIPPVATAFGEIRRISDSRSALQINIELNRSEVWRRPGRVESFPAKLTIETTSVCNLRCVMCPHAVGANSRPKHMPEFLLNKLTPALRHAGDVQLHVLGEPLASPAFWEALDRTAGQTESSIGANTNLTILGSERIERLLDSSIGYLNVSLDAATPETFQKIRGYDFELVLSNARALIEARDRRGAATPRLYFNMTLMLENIREAADFVSLARVLGGDRAYLWHLNSGDGYDWTVERGDFRFVYREQHPSRDPVLSNRMLRLAIERAEKEGIELCLDHNKALFFDECASPRDCSSPWDWMHVNASGEGRPCCFSIGAAGNLNEQSFDEVWNGPLLQEVRRSLAKDELHPFCRGAACKYAAGTRSDDESGL